jgi:hypothetical protein
LGPGGKNWQLISPHKKIVFFLKEYYEPVKPKRKRITKRKQSESDEDFSVKPETDKMGSFTFFDYNVFYLSI